MDFMDLELNRDDGKEKESDRNQEGFTISYPPAPLSFLLLDSDKDIWMDSNQVYNMVIIGRNTPKRTQGSRIVSNTHESFMIF